jgi:hypothetical protein
MKHVGWGVFTRDKIHISDLYTCIDASQLYISSKGWLKRHYMKRIVSALTGRRAWFWQIGLLNKLMIAAGFKENSESSPEGAKGSLDRVCAWIGARINKTPEEVAQTMSVDEIQPMVTAIMKRDLELSLNMIKAHHLPEKFSEEIIDELKKLTEEVMSANKEIQGIKKKIEYDRYGRESKTLAMGFLQPC